MEEEQKPNIENTNAVITQINTPPKKTRQCPHCGQQMEIKDPWKALFRMPTMNEWIILIMMVLMVVAAWAYNHDVKICKDYIKNIDLVCMQRENKYVPTNYTTGVLVINKTEVLNETNQNISNKTWAENATIPFANNSIYVDMNYSNVSNLNTSVVNVTT